MNLTKIKYKTNMSEMEENNYNNIIYFIIIILKM